jgi:putative two-component system response regulator
MVQREREKSKALAAANGKLTAYAEQLHSSIEREQQRAQDIENAYVEMVHRLMHASACKDKETGEHIERLSHYARILAIELGMNTSEADLLYAAAPMHDLGKIGVPDKVLYKEGPLDPEEWKIMKRHPEIGASLLEGSCSPLIELSRQVALCHHERWDGTGYPKGLKGEEIPLAARIVALGDCYDALRSRRPYKQSHSHEHACAVILEGDHRTRPEHFDPQVLRAFCRVHAQFALIFDQLRDPEELQWDG